MSPERFNVVADGFQVPEGNISARLWHRAWDHRRRSPLARTHGFPRNARDVCSYVCPAADVVALYFGRGSLENRFAQEDREFGIDRTFNLHPPGQEWMSGIALFLWNVLVTSGVAAHPLPATINPQEPAPGPPPPPPAILVTEATPALESQELTSAVLGPDASPAPVGTVPEPLTPPTAILRSEAPSAQMAAYDPAEIPADEAELWTI